MGETRRLGAVGLAVFLLVGPARAADIYVPSQYTTIQACLLYTSDAADE